jgi:putative hemolysin
VQKNVLILHPNKAKTTLEEPPDPSLYSFLPLFLFVEASAIGIIIGIVAVLLLLVLSALVSGSEVGFFSLNHNQIEEIRKEKGEQSRKIIDLLDKPKYLLATILIANTVINIAIIIISQMVFSQIFDFGYNPVVVFLVQVVLITFAILVFAEVLPKVYARKNPEKLVLLMCGPLVSLSRLLWPFSYVLVKSTNFFDRRLAAKRPNISMDELEHVLDITTENKASEDGKSILRGIVRFSNITVSEIMKPRVDVVAVDITAPFSSLLSTILDAGYSRIPVYKGSFDNIEGILYSKDLLPYLEKEDTFPWQTLIRPSLFVPESKRINDLLKNFQEQKTHMAFVIDEYGGTSGIVTLEDILEEIVGEIQDEFDTEEDDYTKTGPSTYVFEGKTLLKDFCRATGVDYSVFDKIKGEADTIAGLILEIKQEIPFKGEKIKVPNIEFLVLAVDSRRIKQIQATIKEE